MYVDIIIIGVHLMPTLPDGVMWCELVRHHIVSLVSQVNLVEHIHVAPTLAC